MAKPIKFKALGFRGLAEEISIDLVPGKVAEIAGVNGAGKSSLASALGALLSRSVNPDGIDARRKAKYINDEAGRLKLGLTDGSWSIALETDGRGATALDFVEQGTPPVLPAEVLSLPTIIGQVGDVGGRAWQNLLGYEITETLLRERLIAVIGDIAPTPPDWCPDIAARDEIVDSLMREVDLAGGDWSTAEAVARDRGAAAKRTWEEIVAGAGDSERYGPAKAQGWRPQNWTPLCDELETLTRARLEASRQADKLEGLRRVQYAEAADIEARAKAVERLPAFEKEEARLEELVAGLDRAIEKDGQAQELARLENDAIKLKPVIALLIEEKEKADARLLEMEKSGSEYAAALAAHREAKAAADEAAAGASRQMVMHKARLQKITLDLSGKKVELEDAHKSLAKAKEVAGFKTYAGKVLECPLCGGMLEYEGGGLLAADGGDRAQVQKAKQNIVWLNGKIEDLENRLDDVRDNQPDEPLAPEVPPAPDASGQPRKAALLKVAREQAANYSNQAAQQKAHLNDIACQIKAIGEIDPSGAANNAITAVHQSKTQAELRQVRDKVGAARQTIERVPANALEKQPGQTAVLDAEADYIEARDAANLIEIRDQAADAAFKAAMWIDLVKLLSPQGLRAEVAAQALEGLNAGLAKMAKLAGWPKVEVLYQPWWAVEIAGRPAYIASASERWRAAVIIQAMVAELHACPIMVVDGLDILTEPDAGRALLNEIADRWNFTILLFVSAGSRNQVGGKHYWLNNEGRLLPPATTTGVD